MTTTTTPWRGLVAVLVVAGAAAANASEPCGSEDDEEVELNRFNSMYVMVAFVVLVWIAGKAASQLGLPGLVGEMACGLALGPSGANIVPYAEALRVVGNVGLCLLFVEAGLHVDLEMVELLGARGLTLGVVGTVLPGGLAAGCSILGWGASAVEALAVGAALSTMSTGIALNVLKAGKALNQPIGQLVIAAATVNEILGIILLTMVSNTAEGASAAGYAVPVALTLVLATAAGAAAVSWVPRLLDRVVLPSVPRKRRADALLGLVFATALALVPACAYAGSSELLGAFLAGLCFCSDRNVHETWARQVKRILHWLLRLFFACSVGFAVPAAADPVAAAKAAALVAVALPGKLLMGLFAMPRPLTTDSFLTLALSWGSWGEVAFVVVEVARDALPRSTYEAIVLAVLASIVAMPFGLRRTLERVEAAARGRIDAAVRETEPRNRESAAYFCVQTRSPAHWDLTDSLLGAVDKLGGCEIIDVRSFHPNDHFGLAHCVYELYLRDGSIKLPPLADLAPADAARLDARVALLADALHAALGTCDAHNKEVRVHRWLPGSRLDLDADTGKPVLRPSRPALVVDRRGPVVPRVDDDDDDDSHHPRSCSLLRTFDNPSRRALEAESLAATFVVPPNHELDGYVHTDAHRPFELPDDRDHDLDDELMMRDDAPDVFHLEDPLAGGPPRLVRGFSSQSDHHNHVATSLSQGCVFAVVDLHQDPPPADDARLPPAAASPDAGLALVA